jgi:hypothetical protein
VFWILLRSGRMLTAARAENLRNGIRRIGKSQSLQVGEMFLEGELSTRSSIVIAIPYA